MNSIHRVGLTIAGLATAATVAGAFVADGYFSAHQAAAAAGGYVAAAPTVVYVRPSRTRARCDWSLGQAAWPPFRPW